MVLKHQKSNNKSGYEMISFCITFKEKISFDYPPSSAFIIVNGPLTITFSPHDWLWKKGNQEGYLGHTCSG